MNGLTSRRRGGGSKEEGPSRSDGEGSVQYLMRLTSRWKMKSRLLFDIQRGEGREKKSLFLLNRSQKGEVFHIMGGWRYCP